MSQMVKVLRISVDQLVDGGFTKATVSSGVNVMGIVNLNVSVHLEEQMAAHFKNVREQNKEDQEAEALAEALSKSSGAFGGEASSDKGQNLKKKVAGRRKKKKEASTTSSQPTKPSKSEKECAGEDEQDLDFNLCE